MSDISLKDLCNDIKNNKIVLPDFQREYIWGDEDKQKGFLASILARIPLGNIITFEDSNDSFACKKIGRSSTVDENQLPETVKYLLDGQQRLTTLELIFSNRLFFNEQNTVDLNSLATRTLKKRFFIKMPQYDLLSLTSESDYYGYLTLKMPFNPNDMPSFCSREFDIQTYLVVKSFCKTNDSDQWYYPKAITSRDRTTVAKNSSDEGLIPLFWLLDDESLVRDVIENLADLRFKFLRQTFDFETEKANFKQLNEVFNLIDESELDSYTELNFVEDLEARKKDWSSNMFQYLKNCINDLRINNVEVNREGKERAIDIYEALNMGGVPLSTYDLIIARAAKDTSGKISNLNNLLIEKVKKYYSPDLLNLLNVGLSSWSCDDNLEGIKDGKISKIIVQQFLNLLCIVSNFKREQAIVGSLKPSHCKEKEILKLKPKSIVDYSADTMEAILDALMYLQLKQGIYKLSCIDYNLTILPIAYAFYLCNKQYSSDLLEIINSWYLTAIFTGFYMMDQSTRVINHISQMYTLIKNKKFPTYFRVDKFDSEVKQKVLNVEKYNDFEILKCTDGDNLPSKAVKDYILQLYLSKQNAVDILKDSSGHAIRINAWSNINFEIHHLIPLYHAKTIGESTKKYRSEEMTIFNSIMNLVLITKDSNRTISDFLPSKYVNSMESTFLPTNHFIVDITRLNHSGERIEESQLENIFMQRYINTKNDIIASIQNSVTNLRNRGYSD